MRVYRIVERQTRCSTCQSAKTMPVASGLRYRRGDGLQTTGSGNEIAVPQSTEE